MHSLPVFTSPIITSVVASHYNSALFLRPFSSRCPPIRNSSMTTGRILLTNRTSKEGTSLEGTASFTPLLGLLLFDNLIFIRGLVIFRLHYHQYFYRDNISRWSPTKAEERFTCHWDTAGIIIIIIISNLFSVDWMTFTK